MLHDTVITEPTYYKILGLSPRLSGTLSRQDVKVAYHRTLLHHHPDKINASLSTGKSSPRHTSGVYTVDQITEAYNVLASPVTRAGYDKKLELFATTASGKFVKETLHAGMEVYDLDDLVYNQDGNMWSVGCRCGDPYGYVVLEADLERENGDGEIYVACKGCSLWIKVLFRIVQSDHATEDAENAPDEQQRTGNNVFV